MITCGSQVIEGSYNGGGGGGTVTLTGDTSGSGTGTIVTQTTNLIGTSSFRSDVKSVLGLGIQSGNGVTNC